MQTLSKYVSWIRNVLLFFNVLSLLVPLALVKIDVLMSQFRRFPNSHDCSFGFLYSETQITLLSPRKEGAALQYA